MKAQTPVLNPKEAATYVRSTERTLACWRSLGRGPKFVKVGRFVRYRVTDLDDWLEEHTRQCVTGG
ncbi:hypothetical protein M911_13840 [Ectothiorhodospira haloalkaliphila]|uniref:Helix-turn-helix domain-containing protein n=1 Tax=Ectothiorhodospira haloalkaliphila TaxID=421628 RepID=W8L892_9GAMM|nr:helix-turn-helix domain-containing protein [Ectothiorhodospira haloalkaliphila]AHK80055.1 hypothetical protein M911_13840 [Ectothiorhodospira haloalkaliphila]